jgi:hypothetical protein
MRINVLVLFACIASAQSMLDNQRVVELAHKVSVEELDSIICSSPQVNFRLQDTAALLQAGVSEHTLKTMAAKQNGRPCNAQAPTVADQPVSERPMATATPAAHALPSSAPLAFPPVSLFAGYSYVSADTNGLAGRIGGSGFETSAAFGLTRWLAAESDFGAYYHDFPLPAYLLLGPTAHAHDFSFLGGPRINYGPAFFHVMLGMDRLTGSAQGLSLSQDSLATDLGGGVQIRIPRSPMAFRASVDYLITQHNLVSFGPGFAQNNIRVSAGVVFVTGQQSR